MARAVRLALACLLMLCSLSAAAQDEPALNTGPAQDQGEAYANCMARVAYDARARGNGITYSNQRCTLEPYAAGTKHYVGRWHEAFPGGSAEGGPSGSHRFGEADTCEARGAMAPNWMTGTVQTEQCVAGCQVTIGAATQSKPGINPSTGAAVTWRSHPREYNGTVCTPAGHDQDLDPDHQDETPTQTCQPELGTCITDGKPQFCTFNSDGTPSQCVDAVGDADGDNIPDSTDTHPNDPNNAKDDGGGDEKDNESTSGVDCDNPPISKGDGLLAQIAYQAWKGRCATEKANSAVLSGDPSVCTGTITCTGKNPRECYEIALQRKAACAAQAAATSLANGLSVNIGGASADPNTGPIKDLLTNALGAGNGDDGGAVDTGRAFVEGSGNGGNGGGDGPEPDQNGWLSNRTCPALDVSQVAVMGAAIDFDWSRLCDFLEIGRMMIMVLALAFWARTVASAV